MYRILLYIGLGLLLPGLLAVGTSLMDGPGAWLTDAKTFWGTPISLFVFWIGIAHAGTLISAIFLALNIRVGRRPSVLAELSTLCALAVAGVFPLLHLGVVKNFYMVIPFLDGRGNFANIQSPLVWDFCCIAIYGILSTIFLLIHLLGTKHPGLKQLRYPMAWLLFPLVLWVHTIVSLDFAVAVVPQWQGAFFPLYFIVGAIYSGLAVVIMLLAAEGCRLKLLEKLLVSGSWFMMIFWIWNFALKGDWSVSAFIFGALLPQFWWLRSVRENAIGRVLVATSAVLGMLLERVFLVVPSDEGIYAVNHFGIVDLGLMAFALGLFLTLFAFIRIKCKNSIEGENIAIGELEFSFGEPIRIGRSLTLPLISGIVVSALFVWWSSSQTVFDSFNMNFANVIPLLYPIIALVAATVLCSKQFLPILSGRSKIVLVIILALAGACAGGFWAGGKSSKDSFEIQTENIEYSDGIMENDTLRQWDYYGTKNLWESRCSACHGIDGRFNERFVREFYPVPQKLTAERLESLGEDSLVRVIMDGRVNMNPYGNRLTEREARQLIRYMSILAKEEK